MSQNKDSLKNSHLVAVVGKSLLFPVSLSAKAFWPNLLAMLSKDTAAGPMVMAFGQWPFSEFLTAQDLQNLKGFIVSSGLLATGSLPAEGFEIPPEVLKLSTVMRIAALILANQALNDTRSFKKGLIKADQVRVIFETISRNLELRRSTIEEQQTVWQKTLSEAGIDNEKISSIAATVAKASAEAYGAHAKENLLIHNLAKVFSAHYGFVACPVGDNSPIPGCASWAGEAVKELQSENTGLVIAGGIDSANAVLSWLGRAGDNVTTDLDFCEGLGIIALRRLEDARRDGDQILAIISGVDGSTVKFVNNAEVSAAGKAAPISAAERCERLARFVRMPIADVIEDAAGNSPNLPFNRYPEDIFSAGNNSKEVVSASLDWKRVRERWVKSAGSRRFFHDLLGILCGTFISRIALQSPEAFAAVSSRPVMYLANHQIGIESPLFMAMAYALTGVPIQAVAKPDHVDAWLAFLMAFAQDSLGDNQPFKLMYFDRQNPQSLIDTLKNSGKPDSSLLVHVEGTRSLTADQPVARVSSIFLDMAIEKDIPIVPVRFVGGLPYEQTENRLDFPYGNGKQDYLFGTPILPEQLRKLPYGQRPRLVIDRINNLGPASREDVLLPPEKDFLAKTRFFIENLGLPKIQAMLFAMLQSIDDPCEETAVLLKAVQSGKLDVNKPGFPPVLKNFVTHMKSKFA